MALWLYSVTISNGESIRWHMKSRRCNLSRAFVIHGNLIVRVSSSKWNFRCLKVLKSHQFCKGFGLRCSDIFSVRSDATSSSRGIKTVIAEKVDFGDGLWLAFWKEWSYVKSAAILMSLTLLIIPKADAVDTLKVCTCLLKGCRLELTKCIANPSCAAYMACVETCNNRPDENECQIRCGDLFENSAVDEFNDCAISRKKCVPRKSDVGEFPAPDPDVLVQNFNINNFNGKWFITSGLNPIFDMFDCQVQEFYTESGELVGNLSWRIKTPDTGFFTRSTVQKFVQDPKYILSSKIENQPDDYIFVYYGGRNDAWDEYGGPVVYTRSAVLPESIIPQLQKAAQSIGRDFNKFTMTDNTCGPEPTLSERFKKIVEDGEEIIVKEVEELGQEVEKVKKTEITLLERLAKAFQELIKDKDSFLKELSKEEMDLLNELKMEANEVEEIFGKAIPLRKTR